MSACPDADAEFATILLAYKAAGVPVPATFAKRWSTYSCNQKRLIAYAPPGLQVAMAELVELDIWASKRGILASWKADTDAMVPPELKHLRL